MGPEQPPPPLAADELKQRAAGGAALMIGRGAVILAFGVGANIVLARLLNPRDFGLVALGTVLIVFGTFLGDGGLGAALIRREAPPARRELEAVNALQIAMMVVLALGAAAAGAVVGRDGLVVAVMVAALPIMVLKTPSSILLERRLEYRVIATADVVEAVSFYAWALVTVALGMGVWGMASGMVVRALCGTGTMLRLGPVGLVRPRWSLDAVRPLIGFGIKFQSAPIAGLLRDQSVNVGVAIVAGIPTLGVWNLASRVLQVPFMVFRSAGRIAYPTMARLLGSGADPRPVLQRGLAALAVVAGVVMVALVGFAPALPSLLGPGWSDVPAVLLWSGIALAAAAPMTVGTSGYLFAADRGGTVVLSTCLGAFVWLVVALALLPAVGAPAVGIGWCASSAVQVVMLGREAAARSGARIAASLGVPTVAAVAAATAGWVLARAVGHSLPAGVLGALAGELLLVSALAALARPALRDTGALVRSALRGVGGRSGREGPGAGPGSRARSGAPDEPPGEVGGAPLPVHGPSEGGVLARDAGD